LPKVIISFVMSVRPSVRMEQLHSHWTDFHERDEYLSIFRKKPSRKFKFHYNLTRITGTLHEDQYTFSIISRSDLPRTRNAAGRSCKDNQNTNFMINNFSSKIAPFMR